MPDLFTFKPQLTEMKTSTYGIVAVKNTMKINFFRLACAALSFNTIMRSGGERKLSLFSAFKKGLTWWNDLLRTPCKRNCTFWIC